MSNMDMATLTNGIALQNAEFDALEKLTQCWRAIQLTPVVDDDYPRVRHRYESALRDFLRAAKGNGRIESATPTVIEAARVLTDASYGGSKTAGWHNDPKTGEPRTAEQNKAMFPVRIALCHSELSEALEGDRKDLMDDHLPHRKMAEVELADAVIRIFDLAGAMDYDLGSAIAEKLAYNAKRADHTHAARNAANGKAY